MGFMLRNPLSNHLKMTQMNKELETANYAPCADLRCDMLRAS
jgi:hypothetical protein